MSSDHLEEDGELTIYDYKYLKGDEDYWPRWGAAFSTVHEWCKNKNYGEFGKPTEKGLKAMREYEYATE